MFHSAMNIIIILCIFGGEMKMCIVLLLIHQVSQHNTQKEKRKRLAYAQNMKILLLQICHNHNKERENEERAGRWMGMKTKRNESGQ